MSVSLARKLFLIDFIYRASQLTLFSSFDDARQSKRLFVFLITSSGRPTRAKWSIRSLCLFVFLQLDKRELHGGAVWIRFRSLLSTMKSLYKYFVIGNLLFIVMLVAMMDRFPRSTLIQEELQRSMNLPAEPTELVHNPHLPLQIKYMKSMQRIANFRLSTYTASQRYKWMFLSSLRTYKGMMDRHYFAQFYAAQRHPNIEAILWGDGFPGFDGSLTIIENVRRRFGSLEYFDVIYPLGGSYSAKDFRLASRYTPLMMREHECWGYRCLPAIIDCNVSIFLQTFAYEMDLYHRSFSYNRVIAHSPTSAEPLIFYPPIVLQSDTSPQRDIDLLVVGALSSFVYPLRTRIGQMVQKGLIKNSFIHVHPGYSFENNTVKQTESQMDTYAALLRRAKIVVVDSARYGYALSKYIEVALSGCLILGDLPAEREEEFRRYVVQISMNMTDEQILSIVQFWAKHDDEREVKASLGQHLALNTYTWDHSIDLSLQASLRYRRGEFGIYHNYPYSAKCAPFDNGYVKQATTTKWCSKGTKGVPRRSLCECNRTRINFIDEEPDLDNWKELGMNVNASNPLLHLIPTSLLQYCDSYENIDSFVQRTQYSSLCRCQQVDGSWQNTKICSVSNTALTIARHLVYRDAHRKKRWWCFRNRFRCCTDTSHSFHVNFEVSVRRLTENFIQIITERIATISHLTQWNGVSHRHWEREMTVLSSSSPCNFCSTLPYDKSYRRTHCASTCCSHHTTSFRGPTWASSHLPSAERKMIFVSICEHSITVLVMELCSVWVFHFSWNMSGYFLSGSLRSRLEPPNKKCYCESEWFHLHPTRFNPHITTFIVLRFYPSRIHLDLR